MYLNYNVLKTCKNSKIIVQMIAEYTVCIFRCNCGHCGVDLLVNAREYRCCKEIGECVGKFTFEGKDALCITQHWEYSPITHEAVLKNVGPMLVMKCGTRYKQRNRFRIDNE